MIVRPRPEPDNSEQPLLVNVRDASATLGIGRDSCYELIRDGRLRHVAVGRRLLIPRSELEAFVEREIAGGGDHMSQTAPGGNGRGPRPALQTEAS